MLKKIMLCISLALLSFAPYAQATCEYAGWVKKAMAFYDAKQYKESAEAFSHAFESNGWKGLPDDRYNAGCSWAQAGNKDLAFFQLYRIAEKANYTDIGHMLIDADLVSLHDDARWKPLCDLVQQNKDKAEVNLNKPLVHIPDTVIENDQQYRMQMDDVQKKYGMQSKEMKDLWKTISCNDSIDLIKVRAILDQYGIDEKGGYFLSPPEDPDNVDKRRAEVGLGPLADYISHYNLKWDVEEYKKELPEIEKKEKPY